MSGTFEHRRWYDTNNDISLAINMFMVYPEDVQTTVAETIIDEVGKSVEIYFKPEEQRRMLDHNPAVKVVIDCLGMLDEKNRNRFAKRVVELLSSG